MADTITVAGKHVPKWAAYGGAGVVVVGGVLIWRKRSAGSSGTSSSSQATQTDPVTGLPYSMDSQVDPATGMTYLAEAQQYGSVSAAESAVSAGYGGVSGAGYGYSGLGYGYPASGGGATGTGTGTPATTGATYADNAAWVQAVEAAPPPGYNASDVAAALGKYLAALPLTSTQAAIIQAVVAEYGPPPVGTFSIIAQPSSGGPTSTGSGSGSTPGAPITVNPVGLHASAIYTNSAQVVWTAPTIPHGQGPLTGYTVQCYDKAGHTVNGPFTVPPSQLYGNIGGLKSKTAYHANVWCDPAKSGGPHATVSFTTK